MDKFKLDELTSMVIKAAINVHSELGPGLLENVYTASMKIELDSMGLKAKKEVYLPVIYKGRKISKEGFRIDLLIEDSIVVELKSVEQIQPVHKKQLYTYLRFAEKPVGLLINFNVRLIKEGIARVAYSPHNVSGVVEEKKTGKDKA